MNKIKLVIKVVLINILVLIILLGSYIVYNNLSNNNSNNIKNINKDKINNKKNKKKNNNKDKKDIIEYHNSLPDERNNYNNPYIMGRLEIPDLNINSLVTRYSDNEYYLNYNIYNQYDALGVPFFDYRNINLDSDRQINIYGHNTKNQDYIDNLPFINLEKYTDKSIFDNNKDVYLSIDTRRVHYKVVGIKITDKSDIIHMKLEFSNDSDYLIHINNLFSNTLYKDDNVVINNDNRWLVLQVCHYNPDNTFLLVICQEYTE